ncbi:hypothetical protein C8R43DRAFT_1004156 [Mycena crocata]|nr:hypothetical protein C8R43DRAFT_1004156 [Mycena crocata]
MRLRILCAAAVESASALESTRLELRMHGDQGRHVQVQTRHDTRPAPTAPLTRARRCGCALIDAHCELYDEISRRGS